VLDALQEPHVDAGAAGQLGRLGAAAKQVDQREQAAVVGLVDQRRVVQLGAGRRPLLQRAQRLVQRPLERVAGVDAHRVQVLHVADRDAGVGGVPHHLVLDLLPAPQRALHEDLSDGRGGQAAADHGLQLLGGGDEAAAGASQRVRRPHDQRQPDLAGERPRLGH
jgi:hypothetical protein